MVRKVILTSLFIVFLVLVVLIVKHYFRMQAEMKADGESRSSDGIVHEGSSFNPEIDFITNMAADPNLSLFADVLLDVGPDAIPGTGPFTVFAPINNAMLPFISSQPTRSQKIDLVRHHVVASEYRYEDFIDGCRLERSG